MPKPGRKSGPITEHAKAYESDGLKRGRTVAEWEAERGLPQYSCYPEAAKAQSLTDKGYFMYRDATVEERAIMNKGMFMKIKKNYGDLEAIEAEKQRKRKRDRERYREQRERLSSAAPDTLHTEGVQSDKGV
jgi:hypothetical protein